MSLILNEVKYVKNVLDKGEVGKKPSSTLFLLAKYYYHQENLNKIEIERKLDEFMSKNYPNYNKVFWENIIESISKKANKYNLNEINEISITKSEIKIIETIEDARLERFLFTMLCYAKAYNMIYEKNDGWINTDISLIYNTARLRSKRSDDRFHLVNQLLKLSYNECSMISISKKNTNRNVKVNFIDVDGEIALYISDLRELGYEYMMYKGVGKFVRCASCGRLMRKRKNRKYCSECIQNNPYYSPIGTKTIKCIDCGEEFEVDAKNNNSCRCNKCYKIYRRDYKTKKEKERRSRL